MAYDQEFRGRSGYGPRRSRDLEPGFGPRFSSRFGSRADRRDRRDRGPYGEDFRWPEFPGRLPGRPAHGYPIRGYHTYDMDYGSVGGGPTTDYSGRAGYPLPGELDHRPRDPGRRAPGDREPFRRSVGRSLYEAYDRDYPPGTGEGRGR